MKMRLGSSPRSIKSKRTSPLQPQQRKTSLLSDSSVGRRSSVSPRKHQPSKAPLIAKAKRSPAAIRVAQKIIHARSNISPAKANKGVSPNRAAHAAPTLVYGSPLKMNLFNKEKEKLASRTSVRTKQHPVSQPKVNRSPTKFDWLVQTNNAGNRYSESSPTMTTQYPTSFSPSLVSNAPANPKVSKLKKTTFDSHSSPALPIDRDSPFQTSAFPSKRRMSPSKSRRISPKKYLKSQKSPGGNADGSFKTRASPSSMFKARSAVFNVSPPRNNGRFSKPITEKPDPCLKSIHSPSRLREKSQKVSSPLRFEAKNTAKAPRKSIARPGNSWGASPATKHLSSTLDEQPLAANQELEVHTNEQAEIYQQMMEFDMAPDSNPYAQAIIPLPLDTKSVLFNPAHLLNTEVDTTIKRNSVDKNWFNMNMSEGVQYVGGGGGGSFNDVAHSAPAAQFNFGGNTDARFSQLPISTADHEVDIPRAEVDDLFKEAEKNIGYLKKDVTNKKKGINWVSNSTGAFSMEQLATLKSQISQSFQLCVQMGALEREATGKSTFWENEMSAYNKQRADSDAHEKSVFNLPGIAKADEIVELFSTLMDPAFERIYLYSKGTRPRLDTPVPASLLNILRQHSYAVSPAFVPSLRPSYRVFKKSPFTSTEDQLLLSGVVFFGENDPYSIQHHCLPGRNVMQITNRIRILAKRNKVENCAVKDFLLLPFKPMNMNEKFILRMGIIDYGTKFKNVLPIVFPHIPGPLLEVAWTELYKTGQIPFPWNYAAGGKKASSRAKSLGQKAAKNSASMGRPSWPAQHSRHPPTLQQQQQHQQQLSKNRLVVPFARLPLLASQQQRTGPSSIPLPKRLIQSGPPEEEEEEGDRQPQSDFENYRGEDDDTQLEPLPESISMNPVRGAGRGANPARKKRGRIDKDVIDTSISLKKMRRVPAPVRKSDGPDLEKKRKQRPTQQLAVGDPGP